MRLRAFLPVAIFALAIPLSADSRIEPQSHSWGGYHWARTTSTFVLKVYDNVNATWDTYLSGAQTDWNKSTVLDLNVLWGQSLSSTKRCTSATGVIEVCNDHYGSTGWLGIAGISASGTHITKGYTKLNDTYFDTAQYNTPSWRRMVTCQEVGHDFGLAHQDENFSNTNLGSCMDYTNDPTGKAGTNGTLSNEHPNTHDYDEIKTIYAHLDSTTTIQSIWDVAAASAGEFKQSSFASKSSEFGTPIHFDASGRPDYFALSLGHDENGEHSVDITHVFWAPVDPFADDFDTDTPMPKGWRFH